MTATTEEVDAEETVTKLEMCQIGHKPEVKNNER